MTTQRVFSGIQPTGEPHLGNFLGAIKNYVRMQDGHDAVYCIVDMHAITVPQDPAELRASTLRMGQLLMASGLDPERCILFVQSQVPQHAQLGWLMETTVSFGELSRMTQFRTRATEASSSRARCSPTRRFRLPTSCCTTPTSFPSATINVSIWN